jgi:hypothetical protein
MNPAVGRSVSRKDGMAKTTGAALYVDDLSFPGMIYGRTIRSTIAKGRIRSISLDFDPAGFTIVDYRDIPGPRCNFVALIETTSRSWWRRRSTTSPSPSSSWPTRTASG